MHTTSRKKRELFRLQLKGAIYSRTRMKFMQRLELLKTEI